MANTVTGPIVLNSNPKESSIYMSIASDGTEETDLVIFDSSAIASTLGLTDPLDSSIISVYGSVSSAVTARVFLEWDADTDVLAFDIPCGQTPTKVNFRSLGGLPNQGGTGKTGDITLTTTGLEAGDKITLVLHVRRD
ncbi:MAG TPA: hypothetical protein VGK47_11875 [Nitrososphaeraceae archaeon]